MPILSLLLFGAPVTAAEIDRFWERGSNFSTKGADVKVDPIPGFRPFTVHQAYGPSKLKVKAVGGCSLFNGTKYVGLQTDDGTLVVPPHYSELLVASETVVYGRRLCPLPGDPEWTRRFDRIELPSGTITHTKADRHRRQPLGPALSDLVLEEFVSGSGYNVTLLRPDGSVAIELEGLRESAQPKNFDHFSIPGAGFVELLPGGLLAAHYRAGDGLNAKRWDILYDTDGRRISPELPPLVRIPGGKPEARVFAVPVSTDGLVWPLDAAGGLVPLGDGVVGVRPLVRRVLDVARGTLAFKKKQMLMSGGVVVDIESDRPPPPVPRWSVKDDDTVVGWLAKKEGPDGARWIYVEDLAWLRAGVTDVPTFSEVALLEDLVPHWDAEAVPGWQGLDPMFLGREPGGELAWLRLRADGAIVPELDRAFPDVATADAWIARYSADRATMAVVESSLAAARKEADPVWQAQKKEHAAKVAAAMEAKRQYEYAQEVMKCVTGALCSTEYIGDLLRLAPPGTHGLGELGVMHRARVEANRQATEEYARKLELEKARWAEYDSGGCVLCLPDNPLAAQRDAAWQNYMNGSQGWYINEQNQYVNPSR